MKYRIFLFVVLLGTWLLGYAEDRIDASRVVEREGLVYEIGVDTPFSGLVVDTFVDGQLEEQTSYKDGLKHGSEATWYNNGQLRSKCNYKNGEKDGMWIKFSKDGTVQLQKQYQDGKRVF